MADTPLISVILPVFNAERYLGQAIESVLHQTYPHWELLIVNDGSKDGSMEVVRSFSDSRIRLFEQENGGVSSARNIGLRHMLGEHFCFLDADDALTPISLESRLRVLEGNEAVRYVDGAVEVMDEPMQVTLETRRQAFSGNPFKALLEIDQSCFFGPTWMIRRVPGAVYQFKEGLTHGEDLLFYLSLAKEGLYQAVPEVIYKYRAGNVSAMSNLDGLWAGYKGIYRELRSHFDVSAGNLKKFKRKVTSIMFKSYLGHGRPLAAARVLLEYFDL